MFNPIKYFCLLLTMLFISGEALAAKLDAPTITKFMTQLESVINSGREDTIKQFFKFYSSPESRYIITNYFVNPKKNEELISQDQSEMNRDQFVEFLKNSSASSAAYQYIQTIEKIDLTTSKDMGIITFSYIENILYQKDMGQDFQKTYANCNMTVVVETADVNVTGINCVRKIGRQSTLPDTQSQSKTTETAPQPKTPNTKNQ